MLRSLRTKNFRKLEDNYYEFSSGMVVVRGFNEQGKSTMLESIAYALFGVKSCRGSLAEVVTWGKADTTLSVELVVACDGVDYTITRSKAGAEINYEGGRVTGQNECSGFIERLFGVSNGNVSKLIYGSQGDIRGALSQGPKATAELIENLANFDLIDTVVELVQTNLMTGPTAAAEAVLTAADLRHQLTKAEVVEPDTDGWEETAQGFDQKAAELAAKAETLLPAVAEAKRLMLEATQQKAQASALSSKITMYNDSIVSREASIVALKETNKLCPDTDTYNKAVSDLAAAENAEGLLKEHANMKALMDKFPEDFWEGSELSLDEEITESIAIRDDAVKSIAIQKSDIRVFESQKVVGSICGICEQDVSKFPDVAKKNADLDAIIVVAEDTIKTLAAASADADFDVGIMQGIKALQNKYRALVSENVQTIDLQVPMSLSWVGPDVSKLSTVSVPLARTLVTELKLARDKAQAAEAKVAADTEIISEYALKAKEAEQAIETLTLASSFDALITKYSDLYDAHASHVNEAEEAKFQADSIRQAVVRENEAHSEMLVAVNEAAQDVRIAKKAVDDLVFNNALVKRLRTARPIIADKLWSVVLGAVSSYFSTMRGAASVVTKSSDGFKVDGQSVEGLSGSTLDILGLAIRLALTRTFLPSAPFLILDEATAAMDDKRSTEAMAFLLAFGFSQTICVTHKEIEEGAANQLIQL